MVNFRETLVKSWKETKANPILFVPKIISLIVSATILFLFLTRLNVLSDFISTGFTYGGLSRLLMGLLKNYIFWIYLVIEFSSVVFFSGMSYGMYKDITLNEKISLRKGFGYGTKYFFEILGISSLYYLIIGIPLCGLIYSIVTPIFENFFTQFTFIIFYAIFIFYWVFLVVLRLFFVFAVMVFKNEKMVRTIQVGAAFGKVHFKHTLITWLIVVGITLLFELIKNPSFYKIESTGTIYTIILALVVFTILDVIISVWEHIFIFNIYLEEEISYFSNKT